MQKTRKEVSVQSSLEPMKTIVDLTASETLFEQLAMLTTGYRPDPEQELQEISYYDYPVLKQPFWRWEIIWYFFFGGLAAGCYVIATIASLFGNKEDRVVARTGYYLSLLMLLPCPSIVDQRPGQAGALPEHDAYVQGQIANVNGSMGIAWILSI